MTRRALRSIYLPVSSGRLIAASALVSVALLAASCGDSSDSAKQPGQPSVPAAPPPPPSPINTGGASVITKSTASVTQNGQSLSILFSDFQLRSGAGDSKAAVFNATWPLKLAKDQVAVVSFGHVRGMLMSSAKMPPLQPGQPAPAPRAGDASAAITISVGNWSQTMLWNGQEDSGRQKSESFAVNLSDGVEFRDGAKLPITISAKLAGLTSEQALLAIDALDLKLVVENKPLPVPAPVAPVAPRPVAPGTAPAPQPAAPPSNL